MTEVLLAAVVLASGVGPFGEGGRVRQGMHKRVNGALLDARTVSAGAVLRVSWSLDYDGPRQPLTILEPSLTNYTVGQTELLIYALGHDGQRYYVAFASPSPPCYYFSPREHYVLVGKGASATGEVSVRAADIRAKFARQYPGKFGDRPPPMAWQLIHKPHQRGEAFGLDAWTAGPGQGLASPF